MPLTNRSLRMVRSAAIALAVLSLATTALASRAAGSPRRVEPVPAFGHTHFAARDGATVFERDGRPFFVFAASFFYERLPRSRWRASLNALRDLGVNTLDLYVPWNWHELADGNFDFDGRTSPRRDLRGLLRLLRRFDFALIVRPGPVVRNEWRNGGYPAWLLARPEYGMPPHDRLEGRYPPTATLQNARSDEAAAAWLANATHRRYARRWLTHALHEFAPLADRVLAVALDDDQGAYIDNETWPAPHLARYLTWLRDVVHRATSPGVPVFINTYQMKVTASSPVWAMGNWYQSDAFAIGEHDRAQLDFSTALLRTRPRQPTMVSEFQAGWLEGPDDARPRGADPSNTLLALASMLGDGARGVVNFPLQDTLAPSGWEAPFSNAFYAWDAALRLDGSRSPRARPTARVGAFVRAFGRELAASAPRFDAAIAYETSAYDERSLSNADVGAIADATIGAQRTCRAAALTCALVDLRFASDADLARFRVIVVAHVLDRPFVALAKARLARYVARGGVLVRAMSASDLRAALLRSRRRAAATAPPGAAASVMGAPGAVYAPVAGAGGGEPDARIRGFLTLPNYAGHAIAVHGASVSDARGTLVLPPFVVGARDAVLAPVDVRLHAFAPGFERGDLLRFTDCPLASFGARDRRRIALAFFPRNGPCVVETRIGGRVVNRGNPPERALLGADGTFRPDDRASAAVDALVAGTTPPRPHGLRLRSDAWLPVATPPPVPPGRARASALDLFADGTRAVVLQNALVRVVVAPDAGARAFSFEDLRTHTNVFTTVGAMRDDVAVEPPLSTVDKIARYTHQLPAGTFNRAYAADVIESGARAVARFSAFMPDALPHGARFERTVTLLPGERTFAVDVRASFPGSGSMATFEPVASAVRAAPSAAPSPGLVPAAAGAALQRAVLVSSFSAAEGMTLGNTMLLGPEPEPLEPGSDRDVPVDGAIGFYDARSGRLATLAWRRGDVLAAHVAARNASVLVRLTLANDTTAHVEFGTLTVPDGDGARRAVGAAAARAQGAPSEPANNEP